MAAHDPRMDTESPARFFLTGALLVNAGMLFSLSRELPTEREPLWVFIGAFLVALIAAVPGIAAAVKPTPMVVKACAGVALASSVVIIGVGFFGFVAATMSHKAEANSFFIVVIVLLLMLQVGIVVAASAVLQRSFIHTFGSAVPFAFAAWFSPLVVDAWIGFMRNLLPIS